jgi:peptide-methionine (S)-S-oxide reductase
MTEFVLGGGCFWCIDAVFRRLNGVQLVESGYAGGEGKPDYYQVASGATNFAEVVRVTFDESVMPAEILLDIFFLIHNPTTLNRQGADVGPQYRSTMMYEGERQRDQFTAARDRASQQWHDPIVTEITPLTTYYPAEAEHQDYFSKQPASGYCSIVIAPKIVKARTAYARWFKEDVYEPDEV